MEFYNEVGRFLVPLIGEAALVTVFQKALFLVFLHYSVRSVYRALWVPRGTPQWLAKINPLLHAEIHDLDRELSDLEGTRDGLQKHKAQLTEELQRTAPNQLGRPCPEDVSHEQAMATPRAYAARVRGCDTANLCLHCTHSAGVSG